MILQSCQNCWFNGLQYGPLGLVVGFCSRHQKILNDSAATTCGLQARKDLLHDRAVEVNSIHRQRYDSTQISLLEGGGEAIGRFSDDDRDLDALRKDPVGSAVADYGLLGSKIESLVVLKSTPGARAEVAMLSLSRGYVSNCIQRGGKWTSGLHLFWWTKARLASEPAIGIDDLRSTFGLPLSRQVMLTMWSVVMLRLTLLEDIASHAARANDPLASLVGIADECAASVQQFNFRQLARWLESSALPQMERRLTAKRYAQLSKELHVDVADVEAPV